jgi:hypothetical protein
VVAQPLKRRSCVSIGRYTSRSPHAVSFVWRLRPKALPPIHRQEIGTGAVDSRPGSKMVGSLGLEPSGPEGATDLQSAATSRIRLLPIGAPGRA